MREIIGLEDLVDSLCHRTDISDTGALLALQKFFSVLESGLLEDEYVRIKGLGIFKLIDVGNRKSINIQTGKEIEIESHKKVSFSVDPGLKVSLNKPYSHYEVVELGEKSTLNIENKVETKTEEYSLDNKENEQVSSYVTKRKISYDEIDRELETEGKINRMIMWIILFLLFLIIIMGLIFLMTPEILEQLLYK